MPKATPAAQYPKWRKLGTSSATLYACKAMYGDMDVSQARKLKA